MGFFTRRINRKKSFTTASVLNLFLSKQEAAGTEPAESVLAPSVFEQALELDGKSARDDCKSVDIQPRPLESPEPNRPAEEAVEKPERQQVVVGDTQQDENSIVEWTNAVPRVAPGLSLRRNRGGWKERLERLEERSRGLDAQGRALSDRARINGERPSGRTDDERADARSVRTPGDDSTSEYSTEQSSLWGDKVVDEMRVQKLQLEETIRALTAQNSMLEKQLAREKAFLRSDPRPQTSTPATTPPRVDQMEAFVQVTALVEDLNAEIRSYADAVVNSARPAAPGKDGADRRRATQRIDTAGHQAQHYVGLAMVERLRSTRNIDKTMVSMAVRACLALFCGWIGSSWFFDHTETEQFLNEIYGRIQQNETQAVAGQWRALTRAYLQQMLGGDAAVHSRITSDIDNALASILTVAGFAEDSDTTVHPAAHRKKLSSVVDLALQLNRRIGEDIASTDLETVIVPADREFDPAVMDNTLTAVTASGATVLCTTDLGVRRLERINIAQGAPVVVGSTGTVLLKPRVICKSM